MFSLIGGGARKSGGGQWRESDCMPRPPLTPEAEAMKIQIQAKILKAARDRQSGKKPVNTPKKKKEKSNGGKS